MADPFLVEWWKQQSKRDYRVSVGRPPDEDPNYKRRYGYCKVCGEYKIIRAKGMCSHCYRLDFMKRTGRKI